MNNSFHFAKPVIRIKSFVLQKAIASRISLPVGQSIKMEHLVRWIILEFHSTFLELFPRFTNANQVDTAFSKSTMILHLSTLFLSFIHPVYTDFIVNQPLNHLLLLLQIYIFHLLLLECIRITGLRRR